MSAKFYPVCAHYFPFLSRPPLLSLPSANSLVIAGVKIHPCLPFYPVFFELLSPRPRRTRAAPGCNSLPPRRTSAGPHGRARGAQAEEGGEGAGGAEEGGEGSFTVCLAVGDPGPGMGGIGVVRVALGVQVVEEDVDFVRR